MVVTLILGRRVFPVGEDALFDLVKEGTNYFIDADAVSAEAQIGLALLEWLLGDPDDDQVPDA